MTGTGTVVFASRRQIGIRILWDGDEQPSNYRHDDCVNGVEGLTDLLDGRGVAAGSRVEPCGYPNEGKFRLTGEIAEAPPHEEPEAASSDKTGAQLVAGARTLQAKRDLFFSDTRGPMFPEDHDLLDG